MTDEVRKRMLRDTLLEQKSRLQRIENKINKSTSSANQFITTSILRRYRTMLIENINRGEKALAELLLDEEEQNE